jgi:S-adenosylmethionine decarboxylase
MSAGGTTHVHQPCGLHVLADLRGVAPSLLRDAAGLEALLRRAALAAGARILHGHVHRFGAGGGVTGVLLLAESHLSIHTWPESGFAALDVFMCGGARPQLAVDEIVRALSPAESIIRPIERA